MTGALSNFLSIVGPICWVVLVARARRALTRAKDLERGAAQSNARSKELVEGCNAELLRAQMFRRMRERQASTGCTSVACGSEAPV